MRTTTDRLRLIAERLEQAGRDLQSLVLSADPAVAVPAHDVLNALTVARLEVGMLDETGEL